MQVLTTPPYQFSITIPAKITAGKHYLNAIGGRSGQQSGKSQRLDLDVEPSAQISGISAKPAIMQFDSAGDKLPLRVWGTFSEGPEWTSPSPQARRTAAVIRLRSPSVARVSSPPWVPEN